MCILYAKPDSLNCTADLADVIKRAETRGVDRQIITGTSLAESRDALRLAREHSLKLTPVSDLHATAGCHPTSTSEIDKHKGGADAYFAELDELITAEKAKGDGRLVAIGEIGLGGRRM